MKKFYLLILTLVLLVSCSSNAPVQEDDDFTMPDPNWDKETEEETSEPTEETDEIDITKLDLNDPEDFEIYMDWMMGQFEGDPSVYFVTDTENTTSKLTQNLAQYIDKVYDFSLPLNNRMITFTSKELVSEPQETSNEFIIRLHEFGLSDDELQGFGSDQFSTTLSYHILRDNMNDVSSEEVSQFIDPFLNMMSHLINVEKSDLSAFFIEARDQRKTSEFSDDSIDYRMYDDTSFMVDPNSSEVTTTTSTTREVMMPTWLTVVGRISENNYYESGGNFSGEKISFDTINYVDSEDGRRSNEVAKVMDVYLDASNNDLKVPRSMDIFVELSLHEQDLIDYDMTLTKVENEENYWLIIGMYYDKANIFTHEDASDEFFENRNTYLESFKTLLPDNILTDKTNQLMLESFEDVLRNPTGYEGINLSDSSDYQMVLSKMGNSLAYRFVTKVSPDGDIIGIQP